MKTHLLPALLLTALCLALFSGVYTLVVWGVAQAMPAAGQGQTVASGGREYFVQVGQKFDQNRYFWSRPSAVGYNAAGSGGSNKGPTNPDYLAQVRARVDTFLVHHPSVARSQVPAELVTASGSGLDPHLSPQAALVQADRVAQANGLPPAQVRALVERQTEGPWLGLFGPAKVNVLQLNLALLQLAAQGR
jgi:potassium-transporting ATPase KdpC subunit